MKNYLFLVLLILNIFISNIKADDAAKASNKDRFTLSQAYEIMGLTIGATETDLKKAYKKLQLKYHPDRNPSKDAAEKVKDINSARDIIQRHLEHPQQEDYQKPKQEHHQKPACCKQKADGQKCDYSDECRGSCKCKYPTVAKKCAFGAGGTCINQAKHCDISKC